MKKLLIAVAFLTGCLSEAPAPDDKPMPDDQAAMTSTSQDVTAAPDKLQISPKTCAFGPSCTLDIECRENASSCGPVCIHHPGDPQWGVGRCGVREQ
jgi:hypothetical protein